MNIREYQKGQSKMDNSEESGNIGHRVTKKNKTKTQRNMLWTPLYTNNVDKT